MIESVYILRPLIGAVIGYITNDIAIRMLFRPRTAKYIFGHRVPFTPGIIPKEKARLAASIGDAISKNLMNREVLERTLLSEEMIERIDGGMRGFIDRQRHNHEPLELFLSRYLSDNDIEYIRHNVTADLTEQIHKTLADSGMGSRIAAMAVDHVIEKVRKGLFGKFGADKFLSLIAEPVERQLASNIDEMLARNSRQMVGTLIGDNVERLLITPVSELLRGREKHLDKACETVVDLYRTVVTERLPRILDAVNISKIVESRINEMDVKETERLILEVMNKELRAIVWLGALLGFMMGCLNLLF